MTIVMITEAPLALEKLLAVIDGARVEIDHGVRAKIAASRAVVDRSLAVGEAVYGLTTRVGHGKDTRLTEKEIRGQQQYLVMSHSGGIGPPLATPIVRAALAVRLNGITRGGSGAGVAVAEILVAMLNAGVHCPGAGCWAARSRSPSRTHCRSGWCRRSTARCGSSSPPLDTQFRWS